MNQPVTRKELERQFRDPDGRYGPVDCWWWEAGHLDRAKMTEQLEDLEAKGVSGTWSYPLFVRDEPLRSDPPYWSDEWWELTKFSMDEHARLGLIAWFSDWTANGVFQDKVRAERGEHPEYCGRRLVVYEKRTTTRGPARDHVHDHEEIQYSEPRGPVTIDVPVDDQILHAAAYHATDVGIDFQSQHMLDEHITGNCLKWSVPREHEWVIVVVTSQPNDLDYLNPDVADRWTELLMGRYQKEMPQHVGKALEAYGPDEMFLLDGNILYSPALRERFQAEKGYDPLPFLAGIFFDIGNDSDRIRCDYHDVMSTMLDENCYSRIADRLHEQGMRYTTIATWGREDPIEQVRHYGNFFKMLRHFDVTGNEDPRDKDVYNRHLLDAKFSSSIAHLYDCEQVAVCGYWDSGWGVSQEQNLAFTLANYAFGINKYNRHGGIYTLLGGWYEWVPPAILFHQPHWQYWRHFTDFIRRLSHIMTQGVHVADVALLYPLTTMHAGWQGDEKFSDAAHRSAIACMDLAKAIYYSGVDFDFIDDESICGAACADGELNAAGIGFRAVVLPPLTTIRRDTLSKLKAHHDSGGMVVAMGRLPDASPEGGRDDPEVRRVVQEIFGPDAAGARHASVVHTNQAGGKGVFVPGTCDEVVTELHGCLDRDVIATPSSVFHTHQRCDDYDIFLLFNAEEEARRIQVDLRVDGEPEIWDAFTGETRPVHRFVRRDGRTIVDLDMEIYEGVVLVVNKANARPSIAADNLDALVDVTRDEKAIHITGLSRAGGRAEARIQDGDREISAQADAPAPPGPIALDGNWGVRIEPMLDNKWGDFRYPPSPTRMGPEARIFKFQQEDGNRGEAAGWHETQFDDSDWDEATYTYGPYWWTLGPFQLDREPTQVLEDVAAGKFDSTQTFNDGGPSYQWTELEFSEQFGSIEAAPRRFGGLIGIQDDYLVCRDVPGDQDVVRYLLAIVDAPKAGQWQLDVGRDGATAAGASDPGAPTEGQWRMDAGRDDRLAGGVWVNGEKVITMADPSKVHTHRVSLNAGRNELLMRVVQPKGKKVTAFAVLTDPEHRTINDPYVPLLKWFREPQGLLYDVAPGAERVGWYRFTAPAGLTGFEVPLYAKRVEVWIDGEKVADEAVKCSPRDGQAGKFSVKLNACTNPSQVAMRIEAAAGRYGGAAFDAPIAFECGPGEAPLGDWSAQGLRTYSGAVVYSKSITLTDEHLESQVLLDLGRAGIIADISVNERPAGVRIARPYRLDITDLVQTGENQIEVKVVNTLANHMSSYPTRHILPGQTVSGLLGPAEVRFLRRVTLEAARGKRPATPTP